LYVFSSWNRFAARVKRSASVGDVIARRFNRCLVAACFSSFWAVVLNCKLVDTMRRRFSHRFVIRVYRLWASLTASLTAERQRLSILQLSSKVAISQVESRSQSIELAEATSELAETKQFHALACSELMQENANAFVAFEGDMERKHAVAHQGYLQELDRVRSAFLSELAERSEEQHSLEAETDQLNLASPALESEPEEELGREAQTSTEFIITLDKDFLLIPEGSKARLAFEAEAKSDLAQLLGVNHSEIDITGLRAGSVVLEFSVHGLDIRENAEEDLRQKLMSGTTIANAAVKNVAVKGSRWRSAARMIASANHLSNPAALGEAANARVSTPNVVTHEILRELRRKLEVTQEQYASEASSASRSAKMVEQLQSQIRVVISQAKAVSEATKLAVLLSREEVAEMKEQDRERQRLVLLQREAKTKSLQRDLETLLVAQQDRANEEKAAVIAALEAEIDALKRRIPKQTTADPPPVDLVPAEESPVALLTGAVNTGGPDLQKIANSLSPARLSETKSDHATARAPERLLSISELQPALDSRQTNTELADLELELEADAEVERAVARAEAAAKGCLGVHALQAAATFGNRGSLADHELELETATELECGIVESAPRASSDGAAVPDQLALHVSGSVLASVTDDQTATR
jgi:hypothetical protein